LTGAAVSTVPWRYGIAASMVVLALVVRLALDPVIGSGQVLFTFAVAIVAATRIGGRGPGMFATFLTLPLTAYFLMDPRYSFAVADQREAWSLVAFAVTGIAMNLLIGPRADPMRPVPARLNDGSSLRRMLLFGGTFLALAVLTRLLYSDFAREKERHRWVTHSYQVLNAATALSSNLQGAETGQRGYLLTGDESYLQPFKAALQEEHSVRQTLRSLTGDDPEQQASVHLVDELADAKFDELQKIITLRQTVGTEAALAEVRTDSGKRIMDECREVLRKVEDKEQRLLAHRTQAAEAQAMRMRWVLGLGSGSLMLLLFVAGAVIERDSRDRERARKAMRQSEDRFRLALDAAKAGAWEWDLRTNENVWSDELWHLYGLEPHSRIPSYEVWREIMHPDDRANAEQVVSEVACTGNELTIEFRVPRSVGPERWLLARGRSLRDAAGQPMRFVGIVLDITARKQAEDALRARERDLRHFAEFAPVAIAMFDRDMRYLAASRRFRDDFSLGERELVGRSHYDVFPEIPEHWREIHRRCLAGAVERHPGELFVRPDGADQWIRWEIQPWHQTDGSIGGVILFSEEISQQKQSEEDLRESESQFRTLANAIPQLCWMANADGWIFWYNQRWFEYTGKTPEQMEGWGWQSVHDPAALPRVLERWQESIATGEPFDMIFPLKGADQVFHPFLTRIMPVRDRDGKVVRWFGTNTDISQQQKTEEELRQVSEQRRLALEAAELGAWEQRVDTGEVFLWDDACCRMFGMPAGQRLTLESSRSIYHSEDRAGLVEAVNQALGGANGGAFHHEFRVVWPDGSVHWVASHGRVRFEEAGGQSRPVQFTGILREITRRKQAELEIKQLNAQLEERVRQRTAQLETANRELESFAYSVSHDLRAPLRGIDGWSLALAEDYASLLDTRAQKYLDRVRSEAQRMGCLIDDMLQLSRVARSGMKVGPIDLTGIAQSVADRLQDSNSNRNIEFVIEPGLTGTGDPRLLEIALTNLMANAVKFTGPRMKARIEIGQAHEQGRHPFYVRDNGVGFDMAYADKLFNAFQRLHKASEFPGTGVGLATVQRVIHRHGGRIWAEAQVDQGATFYFTIGETA
jgi:PAS domain S-box-containing protein